jgi:putative glutamine amidotransferase
MKPLIGITMNLREEATRDLNILDLDYGRAVLDAGGIPVPILGIETSIPGLVKQLDGFLFTGGDDIHPRFYHERPLPGVKINVSPDQRTRFEIRLLVAATKARKPVLGICLGTQLINVALGGSLYQDIAAQVGVNVKHGPSGAGQKVFHPVSILEGTKLADIAGSSHIRVRSGHHQSVKNPGKGLRLSALAADGVIEALETRGKSFLIAVQWHPEKTPRDPYTRKLFRAFVAAAKR